MRRYLALTISFFTVLIVPAQRGSVFKRGNQIWQVSVQKGVLKYSYFTDERKNENQDSVLIVKPGSSTPQIAVDTGSSQYRNRVYICWSEKKNGKNNEDVFLIYSDNNGKDWTDPILITYYPNHKYQWEPKMIINADGKVLIAFFDAKNYEGALNFDVTLAVSVNGGLKFDQYKVNKEPLDMRMKPQFRFDDKGSVLLAIHDEKIEQKISISDLVSKNQSAQNVKVLEIPKSLTWNDSLLINFKSVKHLDLTVVLNKALDPLFRKPVVQNKKVYPGSNDLRINFKKLSPPKDNYILNLYYNGTTEYVWIITE